MTKGSQKKPRSSLSRANLVKLEMPTRSTSPNLRRFDPLTAFKTPTSSWQTDSSAHPSQGGFNRKRKTGEQFDTKLPCSVDEHDDRMWVDIYEPTTEAELAVHKKKVDDVRRWLNEAFEGGPSGKLTKYRRLLALTGPAGTAKTATIRVLAREMGFEVMEWWNTMGEGPSNFGDFNNSPHGDIPLSNETLFSTFQAFLNRASNCQNIFSITKSPLSSSLSQCLPVDTHGHTSKRQIILLEDLPNILHSETRDRFHIALRSLVTSPISTPPVPIIIIVSDAGMRGEANDDQAISRGGWAKSKDEAVDIRTVLPRDLLSGPYVTHIGFNPIAPTLLLKALQALLSNHFSTSSQMPPSKEILNAIVETANGDIRSAIMTLQFVSVVQMDRKSGKKKGKRKENTVVLESITRRENSLMLFHLMGRVLYNKRKGDPPSTSASTKDIQREKMIDQQLKDLPKLPPGFQEHERRTSRVDVDTLYADSSIDSSLFSLYIHQNYPQFCDDIEHCDGIAEWLSWVDASGGNTWYQTNPHQFHLLTLGTLHSLPSPVTRRSQKIFKPVFFDFLQKEKDAREGVRDVKAWILGKGTNQESCWSQGTVAMELGGVLKAQSENIVGSRPPMSHRLFSDMGVTSMAGVGQAETLVEGESSVFMDDNNEGHPSQMPEENQGDGGWLDSDDIDDF